MKARNVVLLLAIAVALIGLAGYLSNARRAPTANAGALVFPALDLNAVERVQIASADRTLTLARIQDRWVCTNAYNYPIQFETLKNALIKLSELKVGQVLNVDPARLTELKLAAPSPNTPSEKTGTRIELFGAGNATLASLLLGETRMRKAAAGPEGFGGHPDGRYLSPDGGKTVLLVSDSLDDFQTDPQGWLDTEIWSLSGSDFTEITIRHPGAQALRLVKDKDQSSFKLEGLAPDEETDDVKASSAAAAFSYLRFDHVTDPSATDAATGFTNAIVFTAVATNGVSYIATVGGTGKVGESDGRYVRFQAALPTTLPTNDTARGPIEQNVAEINARLAKWTYLVSNHKADSMTLTRDVLARKKPAETHAVPDSAAVPVPPAAGVETAPATPSDTPAKSVVAIENKAEAIAPTPKDGHPPHQGLPRVQTSETPATK